MGSRWRQDTGLEGSLVSPRAGGCFHVAFCEIIRGSFCIKNKNLELTYFLMEKKKQTAILGSCLYNRNNFLFSTPPKEKQKAFMSYKILMNNVSSEQRMFGALLKSLLGRGLVPRSGDG